MAGTKGHSGVYVRRFPNPFLGKTHNDETRRKMRLAKVGKIRPPMSEETKRKIGIANSVSLKGRKQSPELIAKRTKNQKGEKNCNWKGDEVSYVPLHSWVARWKGKPKKCEVCGTEEAKKYEWANIDHKYRRVLEDYTRMCTRCHRKFDINNNLYIPFGALRK